MKNQKEINILEQRLRLLEEYVSIVLDFSLDKDVLSAAFDKRQQIVDHLQLLDADFEKIKGIRKNSWSNFDSVEIQLAEVLVQKGNKICEQIMSQERQHIENAQLFRQKVSKQIDNLRLIKSYVPTSKASFVSPSVIVDSHF